MRDCHYRFEFRLEMDLRLLLFKDSQRGGSKTAKHVKEIFGPISSWHRNLFPS